MLTYTDTYVHDNTRIYGDGGGTMNPVGFYQVLWDDGTIERVPYDKRLYVRKGTVNNSGQGWEGVLAFPGEAGVPDGALTYDEYYTKRGGWKAAPRGRVDGPGMSYNGRPRP